jgi:hypothetical protein
LLRRVLSSLDNMATTDHVPSLQLVSLNICEIREGLTPCHTECASTNNVRSPVG